MTTPRVRVQLRAGGDRSVLGWSQPVLPPLPPGEAQRVQGWEVYGAEAKHPPQTAPGYQAAQQLGLLPPPAPATPPQRLPGLSAHAMLLTGIGLFFGTILLLVVLADDAPGVMFASLMIGGGGGALWMLFRLGRWRRRPHNWLRWPEIPYLDGVPNRAEGGESQAGASPE